MLVRDPQKQRRQLAGFGAFGGEWEDWCDTASNVWPNAGERAGLNTKCHAWSVFAPWTVVGKGMRGLPLNFSTQPATAQGGAAAVIMQTAKDVMTTVQKTVAPTAQMQTQPQALPQVQTVGGGSIEVVTQSQARQAQMQQQLQLQQQQQQQQAASSRNTMLIVGGVAVLGVAAVAFAMKSKSFSGYSYRRSHRRARR